ncbi:MAG: hypothetical protein A2729_05670 [Candidatus Buchananbacteria bacterium RIFCSPHIGHO2_01_FULL_39_14]|uniref:Phosphoesterase n=2 Tax=Candidatus Buchananiibacteriota TaxID=1817903 RepID=A0A1G1YSN6_9BACT|nr:MAG: hypothetical protein A2729_05670 [Candidatus Buchananbacteria bacterium RIFCSPHIGHO2_01_FULL_39_14]OGY48475.1 MAG: hypothetical protein A3D39_02485 [Candidatus Buchananbacteria bacterium RIFCSPHIGHO2_02_FULL_39_17]OGY55314.1 MAG: hypothetical protein A2912_02600 [Candidatus Buchananbacteria bacterium RIFCSPLOWO2_01_FULL_40_23b]
MVESALTKIAVISDSHDNLVNIYRALSFIKKQKIKTIIHCGDVCAPAVLEEIAKKFKGKIHLVFGNVDGDQKMMKAVATKFKNIIIHGQTGQLEFGGRTVVFTHYPWLAQKLAQSQKYDALFYGHDHRVWEKKIGKTVLRNPGTLAGLFARATFAIYDPKTDKAELILLERI